MALPFVEGRALAPEWGLLAAERSIESARRAEADHYAPELFAAADSVFAQAQTQFAMEKARFAPLRDYRQTRALLDEATERADIAEMAAQDDERRRLLQAERTLYEAERSLARAEALRDAHVLDASSRRSLQEARVRLRDGLARQTGGDPGPAEALGRSVLNVADEIVERSVGRISRFGDESQLLVWRDWIESSIEESRKTGGSLVVVNKEKGELSLYQTGRLLARYRAECGRSFDRKLIEGDMATPEGRFRVVSKKGRGETKYYRALLLDFPTTEDWDRIRRAKKNGQVPGDAEPGGLIEIHGEGGRGWNWTKGCVALSNSDMDQIYDRVEVGTRVTIVGGEGSDGTYSRLIEALDNGTGEEQ